MSYDLLIKNGLVILDNGEIETDVAIKDGKIAAIGSDLGDAAEVIDAKRPGSQPWYGGRTRAYHRSRRQLP